MKLSTPSVSRPKINIPDRVNGKNGARNGKANGSAGKDLEMMDLRGQIAAINKAQAVIEFDMSGTILNANENFLKVVGYTLDEVKGRHHSLFVEAAYRDSADYKQFWRDLNEGKFVAAEFKRIGKGGKEIWLQASYNPIFDAQGKPFKVVKYATDVSARLHPGPNLLAVTAYNKPGPPQNPAGLIGRLRLDFAEALAHKIQGGADLLLMPSRFEPCGLTPMYALKYGTIPVVRATGGLDDTVVQWNARTGKGNGFKFAELSANALTRAVGDAMAVYKQPRLWQKLMRNAMACDFSWRQAAREYEKLYAGLINAP